MAALGHLAREEVVVRHEAGQEREAVEGRVATGVEDEHGGELDHQEQEVPQRPGAEDRLDLLRHDGRGPLSERDGVGPAGEQRRAEHEEAEHGAHRHQRLAGVAAGWVPEGAHAVADGLEAGERRATVGEGPQELDVGQAHQPAGAGSAELVVDEKVGRWDGKDLQGPGELLPEPDEDDARQGDHVEVGREGEDPSCLLDPPEVPIDEDEHDTDRDQEGRALEPRHRRGERRGAGRGLHGDGHGVVDQEGDRGDLRDLGSEVVTSDDVRAADARVEADDVEVRQGDEEQDADDGHRDRHHQRERGETDVRRHLGEDLLGPVGRRRDAVRCEHAQGRRLAHALAGELLGDQRLAEHPVLDPVPGRLGELLGQVARHRPARDEPL